MTRPLTNPGKGEMAARPNDLPFASSDSGPTPIKAFYRSFDLPAEEQRQTTLACSCALLDFVVME